MVFGRRYRVTEKIGSGGMADVYKAVDEVLGRTVAVKVMHSRYASDPTFAARFRQEAQAAANLQSPYIVNMYDWGQDGDTYYIVMELVRGADLKSIIQQKGALEAVRVAQIGAQVCQALSVAHGYDVIHRDVKPHNIMVAPDGSVKVMDFGIARAGNTTMTQTGSVLGTAHYVSPEQAQGKPLTAASDLYSLGVVLYEAATGRLPFDADTPVAVALKQVHEAPKRPSELRADFDPGLEAVILMAMAKQPAERYETAEEMRRDLLRVAQGIDVEATTVLPAAAAGAAAAAAAAETAVMPQVGTRKQQPPAAPPARPVPERRNVWPWLLLGLLLIVGGLGVAWAMGLLGPQGAPVPDVVGRDIQDAQQIITEAGFVVGEITPEYSKEVPEGQVIDQSPVANATAEKESAVDLTVSRGPKLVAVPKLIGLKEQQARAALDKAGFVPNPLPDAYSSEFAVGIVFKQTPKAGAKVEEGSEVQYVVSRGKRTVKVPDVRTKSRGAAESTLREAGFKVTVSEASDDRIAAGRVISQSPAAGTEVVEGSTVSIVVSTGPALVEVPDVIGSTEMEARATLENAGFKVEVTYEPHSENGTVLDQDPKNPTKVKPGSTVVIVIDAAEP